VTDAQADAALRAWTAQLPQITAGLARRWSLRLGRPFESGPASWVAPALTEAGERVVLKAGWLHEEALHEADGLRVWAGHGTVRLLAADTSGPTSALLLEACEPGTELAVALPEDERDEVIAGLLRRLWIEPPAGHPFRPLIQMCEDWAARFVRDSAAARARGQDQLDPGIARAGIELFRELPGAAGRAVLLCTDLHHHNVLAATREPWLVIDPKPYLGDPCYDVLQHMLNFPHRLAADPAGFARRMAAVADLDQERVMLWLFARCVQESADDATLRAAAVALAP
jgi:streptomycin 6-kinase